MPRSVRLERAVWATDVAANVSPADKPARSARRRNPHEHQRRCDFRKSLKLAWHFRAAGRTPSTSGETPDATSAIAVHSLLNYTGQPTVFRAIELPLGLHFAPWASRNASKS